jgi:hypothetical protein
MVGMWSKCFIACTEQGIRYHIEFLYTTNIHDKTTVRGTWRKFLCIFNSIL